MYGTAGEREGKGRGITFPFGTERHGKSHTITHTYTHIAWRARGAGGGGSFCSRSPGLFVV
jgi:hypothetical protein